MAQHHEGFMEFQNCSEGAVICDYAGTVHARFSRSFPLPIIVYRPYTTTTFMLYRGQTAVLHSSYIQAKSNHAQIPTVALLLRFAFAFPALLHFEQLAQLLLLADALLVHLAHHGGHHTHVP